MTTIIDKRAIPLTTTFDELEIGDCYQDDKGYICFKTARDRCMYFDTDRGYWSTAGQDLDDLIIPLKATITVERKES